MQKRILFAVLNWGLGHASRSLVVIKALLHEGHSVEIASDGAAAEFLINELPNCSFHNLQGYQISYQEEAGHFTIKMLTQLPKVLRAIKNERREINKIIEVGSFDMIISDSRYGAYHNSVPSYLIAHQLHLKYPDAALMERFINLGYQRFLRPFDKLLVPDEPVKDSLSGSLSSIYEGPKEYIGILSSIHRNPAETKYNIVAILSGPEPQRSIFESHLLKALDSIPGRHFLVRGANGLRKIEEDGKGDLEIEERVGRDRIEAIINQGEIIVCRSGYSSIMDLVNLGKKAVLIPTPGQSEQEYLASRVEAKKWFKVLKQDELQYLNEAIQGLSEYTPPAISSRERLKNFLASI